MNILKKVLFESFIRQLSSRRVEITYSILKQILREIDRIL